MTTPDSMVSLAAEIATAILRMESVRSSAVVLIESHSKRLRYEQSKNIIVIRRVTAHGFGTISGREGGYGSRIAGG